MLLNNSYSIQRKSQGFTLIELMITISVMAILAIIALPNMTTWLQSRRVAGKAEQFANLMRFARTEAVRLNVPVYVCPVQIKKDGKSDQPCTDAKYAQQGWAAYADLKRDGKYERKSDDISLRTFILNNNNQDDYSYRAIAIPFSGKQTNVSMFAFRPDGAFGYADQLSSSKISWRQGHVLIQIAATNNSKKHEAKGLENILIDSSGRVDICLRQDERAICNSLKNEG